MFGEYIAARNVDRSVNSRVTEKGGIKRRVFQLSDIAFYVNMYPKYSSKFNIDI
jgi:hypothetical protein